MVRLAESSYAKVRRSIEEVGVCTQIYHKLGDCHICLRNTMNTLKWIRKTKEGPKEVWCLCDYHKREVGVLW